MPRIKPRQEPTMAWIMNKTGRLLRAGERIRCLEDGECVVLHVTPSAARVQPVAKKTSTFTPRFEDEEVSITTAKSAFYIAAEAEVEVLRRVMRRAV